MLHSDPQVCRKRSISPDLLAFPVQMRVTVFQRYVYAELQTSPNFAHFRPHSPDRNPQGSNFRSNLWFAEDDIDSRSPIPG